MALWLVAVTACYVTLSIAVGLCRLRGRNYTDFVASPSTINKYAISLSICGTVIGGGMFFAVAQMGYEAGLAVLALPLSYVLGYLLLGFAIPAIRKSISSPGVNTLYDVVTVRLSRSGPWASTYKLLLSLVTFGMYFFMLAAQFTIIANFYMGVLSLTPRMAWMMSLLLIGGTTLIYSVAGGIRKDIATDIFQVPVVLMGLVVIGVFLLTDNKVSFVNVPRTHFTFTGYGVAFPIAVLLFFSPAFVGRYDYWQRIIAAKSVPEARFALWFSLPIILVAYVVCCLIGVAARSMSPTTESSRAALWFMRNALPSGLSTVVILSFYAALMATSDTLLNVSSVSLSSILQSLTRGRCKPLRTLGVLRALTVIVGIAASATVLIAADTVDLIIGGFSSLAILTPSLLLVLLKREPDARVACASLTFGYASFILAFSCVPSLRKYAFVLGFVVGCVTLGLAQLACSGMPSFSRRGPTG